MDKQEFKFPDEQTGKPESKDEKLEIINEGDVDVEVVDDTPEPDRNRKPLPSNLVEELENDDLDKYDTSVRDRLKQMKKVWHDERRAKESASREKDEALRIAQAYVDENKRLKQYVASGEQVYAGTLKTSAEAELEVAKRKYREAHEAFDSDALVEAQLALNQAQMKLVQANNFRPTPLQDENDDVKHATTEASTPKPDERFERWLRDNSWYGSKESPTDELMSDFAFVTHTRLAREGVPVGSEYYYQQIDERMRAAFPSAFKAEQRGDEGQKQDAPRRAAPTVVAPTNRSSGAKRITLTKTQQALVKKYGLTPEAYAKEVLKLEM